MKDDPFLNQETLLMWEFGIICLLPMAYLKVAKEIVQVRDQSSLEIYKLHEVRDRTGKNIMDTIEPYFQGSIHQTLNKQA